LLDSADSHPAHKAQPFQLGFIPDRINPVMSVWQGVYQRLAINNAIASFWLCSIVELTDYFGTVLSVRMAYLNGSFVPLRSPLINYVHMKLW